MARIIGDGDIDAAGLKLGIVVSMFNDQITKKMLDGALSTARDMGIAEEDITVCWVAGAFELPLIAQELAEAQNIDAVRGVDDLRFAQRLGQRFRRHRPRVQHVPAGEYALDLLDA